MRPKHAEEALQINQFKNQFKINCSMIISKAGTHKATKKRSVSIQHRDKNLSRNEQKILISLDQTGFIIENSILLMGLQCQCLVQNNSFINNQSAPIKNRINSTEQEKILIHLDKSNIYVQKNSVQHIFPLPQHINNHLKVVLNQQYEICNFTIINKKLKIVKNTVNLQFDQIRPLELVFQTDRIRRQNFEKKKTKNICWNSQKIAKTKGIQELKINNLIKSSIILPDVFPRSQTSRINLNTKPYTWEFQIDQTKDSQKISGKNLQLKNTKNCNLKVKLNLWGKNRKKSQHYEENQGQIYINEDIRKSLIVERS